MRRLRWLFLGLATALVIWTGYRYYEAHYKIPPEELLNRALEKTMAAPGYRYRVEAEIVVDDQHRVLSQVEGERDQSGNFHIWGEQGGERVEIYQIEDTTYLLDAGSEKWLVIPGNDLGRQSTMMIEIDPLSILRFENMGLITYGGKQRAGEMKGTLRFEFRPELVSDFMNKWFQDVSCRVWVDRRAHWVREAVLEAVSVSDLRARATFDVHLWDFGAKIKLEPPL